MYIVSQTETVAVNIDNISTIEVVDNCIVAIINQDTQAVLGRYRCFDRACEVFTEILNNIGVNVWYMPDN